MRSKSFSRESHVVFTLLWEGKLDRLRAQFPQYTDDQWIYIVNADPSKTKKFVEWIAKVAVPDLSVEEGADNPTFPNYALGSSGRVKDSIEKFDKRQRQKINDIYQFKSFEEFEKYLEDSKTNRERLAEEADVIYKDDRWTVTHPKTHWAMKNVGGSTDWCVATENEAHWKDYVRRGSFVVIKDKSIPDTDPMHKIAVHGYTDDDNFEQADSDLTFYNSNNSPLDQADISALSGELPEGVEDEIVSYLSYEDYQDKLLDYEQEASLETFEKEGVDSFFWAFNKYLDSKYNSHDSAYVDSIEELAEKDASLKDEVKHLAYVVWYETQQHHGVDFDGYNFLFPHPDAETLFKMFDKEEGYSFIDDEAKETFNKLVELYLDKSNIYSKDINSRLHDYGRLGAREAMVDRYGQDFKELDELVANAKKKIYLNTSGREGRPLVQSDKGFKFKNVPDGIAGVEMILRYAGYDEDADFIRQHVLESSLKGVVSAMFG